jgi:hypothetical protein
MRLYKYYIYDRKRKIFTNKKYNIIIMSLFITKVIFDLIKIKRIASVIIYPFIYSSVIFSLFLLFGFFVKNFHKFLIFFLIYFYFFYLFYTLNFLHFIYLIIALNN